MSVVHIKQIPDDYAESTGLAKYGRSRMPGCSDVFQASLNVDGRFVTGVDEEGYGVPKERKDELKEKREFLEKKIGKDLTGTSAFWQDYFIEIHADNPKPFDLDIPTDYIAYRVLLANGFVAPTKEDAFTPKYKDAQYYAYTEETEDQEEVSTNKKRDKALAVLLDISEDKEKMLLYGQYLEGIKYSPKFKEDTLYKMLRIYIKDKNIKNAENFLSVVNIPIEKIQQKIIIDKALKQRLIVKAKAGKKQVYQYGQVTLGTSIEDVYANLSSPDFAPELLALKNELSL